MPSQKCPGTPRTSIDKYGNDANDLVALSQDQTLPRQFDIWSILAFAFCVLATWSTFAQNLAVGLTNGGPVNIVWGLILVGTCNVCVAISLGELCSSMPTALGQAYWVYRLWNTPTGRFFSYLCAWVSTFGWWALTASAIAFMTNFLLAMKVMFDSTWQGVNQGWLLFIVYFGVTLLFTVFNLVACRKDRVLPLFNDFTGVGFILLFFAFSLALLACTGSKADLDFQSAHFVFATWINETGWSDGVTWFTGLVQAAYGLTAYDAVIHIVEEIPDPRRNAPKAIYLSVVCSAVSGLIFMIICLFCIQDIDAVINTPTGLPFIQLVQDAVGLKGSAILIGLFIFNGLGQGISVLTTGSRLTWGFARDAGLPWSTYFGHIDTYWKVPARALWLQCAIITAIGLLYLFANTVLEAILSVSTIALTVSYSMPIMSLLIVGRDTMTPGPFHLGKYGLLVNTIAVIYCSITIVFFFFPGTPNPSTGDMNYAIAIFGIMLVVATAFWFIKGRKTFLQTEDGIERIILARRMGADEV
ncbi:putative amino acid permease family protein [Fusarium solani]|uniref:Amino acid permease family protein n=1 Tax=Fusarium solani TaxID=169388 RepID=A0A9P9H938_FUSSL|nr:putative amino acid permease family protein [Fusarium solani]KAH7253384.1 putative amino acid permease family protein [Fusarium solani]